MAPFILVTGSTTSAMAKVLCPNYSYLGIGHLVKAVTHLCIIRKASMISAIESCEMQFSAQIPHFQLQLYTFCQFLSMLALNAQNLLQVKAQWEMAAFTRWVSISVLFLEHDMQAAWLNLCV